MDIDELEAKIVEQLRNLIDAHKGQKEIRWYYNTLKSQMPDTGGYYTLKTALAMAHERDAMMRELTAISKAIDYEVRRENNVYKELKKLIPDELKTMDLGFDVDGFRFHVMKRYDDIVTIKKQEITCV